MTFSEIFKSVGGAIVKAAKAVYGALMNASIVNIVKGAIFVGGAVSVAYIILEHFVGNHKNFKKKKDETPVDRSLCFNVDDESEAESNNINPLMKNSDSLKKERAKLRKEFLEMKFEPNNGPIKKLGRKRSSEYNRKQMKDLEELTKKVEEILLPNQHPYIEPHTKKELKDEMDEYEKMVKIMSQNYDKYERENTWKKESEDNFVLPRILNTQGV